MLYADDTPTPRVSTRVKSGEREPLCLASPEQRVSAESANDDGGRTHLDSVDEVVFGDTVDVLQPVRRRDGSAGSSRDKIDLFKRGAGAGKQRKQNGRQ